MITIFPGMGANHQMYGPEWQALLPCGLRFIDWPQDYIPKSIVDLADHCAQQSGDKETVVIGSSMGGMVALEYARLKGVTHVVLLGSTTSSSEINAFLKALGPLVAITPMRLCTALAGKGGHLLSHMFADQNPDFIRTMVQHCLAWHFTGQLQTLKIHGRSDRVIQAKQADCWLDAGHLVAMSHPEACLQAIQAWMADEGLCSISGGG